MNDTPPNWRAHWIWTSAGRAAANYHCYARKTFELDSSVLKAQLHITAGTDYVLYVNGVFVGRGPTPSDPACQYYDSYDVKGNLLSGKNVIAVLCHNYGVGTHWQYGGPGGLFCQLDIETDDGSLSILSEESWKIKSADCFAHNSPRAFWSCGFAETVNFNHFDPAWMQTETSDAHWPAAIVVGAHPMRPFQRLVPREIPFLREDPDERPLSVEKGSFTMRGVHTVRFDDLLPSGQTGIVYAQTWFYTSQPIDLVLNLECDDACRVFLNGELVGDQTYDPAQVCTKLWRGSDDYDQVHYGMHLQYGVKRRLHLKADWNKCLVAVDHGCDGWGFAMTWSDPQTTRAVDLQFAADCATRHEWDLAGPFPSSGLSDSLDNLADDIAKLNSSRGSGCLRLDDPRATDYSLLMHFEERTPVTAPLVKENLTLYAGEYCIYDLGKVKVGFPHLDLNARGDTVLDIGYSHTCQSDRRVRFSNDGAMKNVDRLILRKGDQRWEPIQRRNGRYIHLSCRSGQVRLSSPGIRSLGYPLQDIATFECSDAHLNRIWEVSRYTSRLLMQYGYQDCLKREQGVCNTNQATYQSLAAAYAFGDNRLARKCLLTIIRTQQDDGWFHSHGPSTPNQDEITLCLYWTIWLLQYYQLSGDLDFVREVFPAAEDNLRYFSKMTDRSGLIDGRYMLYSRPGQIIYMDDAHDHGPYLGHYSGQLAGFTILFSAALEAAGSLAEALGEANRAGYYRCKAERSRSACSAKFWEPQRGLFADAWQDGKRAEVYHPVLQIAAVYHGLADQQQTESILRYLLDDLGFPEPDQPDYPLYTFGYYFYFLEVLFKNGCDRQAMELMRAFYGTWLESGATTFGEYYRPSDLKDKPLWEYEVHGYGTSAHAHFYTNILGVRPAEAGFKQAIVAPHPGDLEWAKGRVATPAGIIAVSWKVDNGQMTIEVQAPPVCACKVVPPAQYPHAEVKVYETGDAE